MHILMLHRMQVNSCRIGNTFLNYTRLEVITLQDTTGFYLLSIHKGNNWNDTSYALICSVSFLQSLFERLFLNQA